MGRTEPYYEVIYEFVRVGDYVKVSAVDPLSLTEVSIVGSPRADEETLKRTARRKLDYVLRKRQKARSRSTENQSRSDD